MAVIIREGQEILWGTSSAGTVTQGKILSADRTRDSKVHEQEDENGETYSLVFYDPKDEVEIEVLAKPGATIPAPGDALTVGGVASLYVLRASEKWSSNNSKKISISARTVTPGSGT